MYEDKSKKNETTFIKEGDVVSGTIIRVKDDYVLVKVGNTTGLLHRNNIPDIDNTLTNLFNEGDSIESKVIKVKEGGRLSLSKKYKLPNKKLAQKVKEEINLLSDKDQNIRSIWMKLVDIQYYMLKYLQMPIPTDAVSAFFSEDSKCFNINANTEIHVEDFNKEIESIYNTTPLMHPYIQGYGYFEANVELVERANRESISDRCANMYINLLPNPAREVWISDISSSDVSKLVSKISEYYANLMYFKIDKRLCFLIPYSNKEEGDNLNEELNFILNFIRNGQLVNDNLEQNLDAYDELNEKSEAIVFSYEIVPLKLGKDRFYFSRNMDLLIDKEGERFNALVGQQFYVGTTDKIVPIGTLKRIKKFPELSFALQADDVNALKNYLSNNGINMIIPDTNDIVGEVEKINRLRDSFSRITDYPEELVNPNLALYLFDASKAESNSAVEIENIVADIKNNQLNTSLNDSQVNAIAKAILANDLAVIQGPPGTGKSTAIAELIWQLIRRDKSSRLLLTSEANLAVDNALDRLKYSSHNLVKPIRIASGDKFSAEGLPYAITEMKKWAGIELNETEKEDDEATKITDEFTYYNPSDVVLNRWMKNIYRRAANTINEDCLRKLWYDFLIDLPSDFRKIIYKEYVSQCNLIGATCSAISDTNYTRTNETGKHKDSKFFKKYKAIFGEEEDGYPINLRFSTVIQDEASKATPIELALPLAYGQRAIVIGDHRQLPPNLDRADILFKLNIQKNRANSPEEIKKINELEQYVKHNFDILEKSHFERLYSQIDKSLRGTFNTQYRMHEHINDVIKQFYIEDGGLECGVRNEDREHHIMVEGIVEPKDHVIWINTDTPEFREGTSRANNGEVKAIEWLLKQFGKSKSFREFQNKQTTTEDKEIGLITFYSGQMKRLKKSIDAANADGMHIKMSSVDRFQGMERNIIIVSLVRSDSIAQLWNQRPDYHMYGKKGYPSQEDLGFAKSPNRLNVALSRAKRLLIIVGNSEHFCKYKNKHGIAIYKNVYDSINQNGKILNWNTIQQDNSLIQIKRVPMPTKRSVNLNTRDININAESHLRHIDTILSKRLTDNPHFAVLELSTKAVKLLYATDENLIKTEPFAFEKFIRFAEKTETGKGLNENNEMDMSYFRNRVLPVIRRMKHQMNEAGIDVVCTVATAAYRTAKNREEVVECLRREVGINVRILSKREESVATMYAYVFSTRYKNMLLSSPHTIMIEQGGGSTEVSVFNKTNYIDSYSLNYGTTSSRNMLIQCMEDGYSISDAFRRCDQMVKDRMVALMRNIGDTLNADGETFCVSVGTAITNATGKRGNAKQHDSVLTYEQITYRIEVSENKILERFSSVDEFIRWENNSVDDRGNIDTLITMRLGLPLYLVFMERFGIKEIYVSGTGLWYGMYFQKLYKVLDC